MITFKEFLIEKRDEHEIHIRKISSDARRSWFKNKKKSKDSFSKYGHCVGVSRCVANALKKKYPSTRVVAGNKNKTEHDWVEIPELKRAVDPTHDQFHKFHKFRKKVPNVKGILPDNSVKVMKHDDKYYNSNYKKKYDLD